MQASTMKRVYVCRVHCASAAVKKVNLGNEPPKIGNLQVLRNRYGRQVCEADIAFNAKDMGITVRLTLRTANSVVKFITAGVRT
jgi:hypothetical protein